MHVEFHETGRAACFWIDVHPDRQTTARSPQQRMETLILSALTPVVRALEATGEINGKLIWSNTGYLIHWYLTEMKPLLGDELLAALRGPASLRNNSPVARIIHSGAPWCHVTGC